MTRVRIPADPGLRHSSPSLDFRKGLLLPRAAPALATRSSTCLSDLPSLASPGSRLAIVCSGFPLPPPLRVPATRTPFFWPFTFPFLRFILNSGTAQSLTPREGVSSRNIAPRVGSCTEALYSFRILNDCSAISTTDLRHSAEARYCVTVKFPPFLRRAFPFLSLSFGSAARVMHISFPGCGAPHTRIHE